MYVSQSFPTGGSRTPGGFLGSGISGVVETFSDFCFVCVVLSFSANLLSIVSALSYCVYCKQEYLKMLRECGTIKRLGTTDLM